MFYLRGFYGRCQLRHQKFHLFRQLPQRLTSLANNLQPLVGQPHVAVILSLLWTLRPENEAEAAATIPKIKAALAVCDSAIILFVARWKEPGKD